MSRRKVYIVKSGTLHPTTGQYNLRPIHFTSKKGAEAEFNQVLEVNQAKDIKDWDEMVKHDENILKFVDYVGENGKYKARLILEWAWLNQY